MSHSLNSARQTLRIGKAKLYRVLDDLGIEPSIEGNSKLLSDVQLDLVREAIQGGFGPVPKDCSESIDTVLQDNKDKASTVLSSTQDRNNTAYSDLRDEVVHLRKMLDAERQDRQEKDFRHDEMLKAFNQSTERFQAMLLQLQSKNNELSQKLLDVPKEQEKSSLDMGSQSPLNADASIEKVPLANNTKTSFATPFIWAVAAAVLTVSIIELGGVSVGNILRDLLAAS
jgi:hypothetical protein